MSSFLARRIETLSDIIFAVAMTEPIYSLPFPDRAGPVTGLMPLLRPMLWPGFALGVSFLFSGIFWFSHHRRLTHTSANSRRYLFVTFAFLFLIVLLPVPTILYGRYGAIPSIAAFFSGYLALIATVNAALWLEAIAKLPSRPWRMVAGPGVLAGVFLLAALVSLRDPALGSALWLATALAPVADAIATRVPL